MTQDQKAIEARIAEALPCKCNACGIHWYNCPATCRAAILALVLDERKRMKEEACASVAVGEQKWREESACTEADCGCWVQYVQDAIRADAEPEGGA